MNGFPLARFSVLDSAEHVFPTASATKKSRLSKKATIDHYDSLLRRSVGWKG